MTRHFKLSSWWASGWPVATKLRTTANSCSQWITSFQSSRDQNWRMEKLNLFKSDNDQWSIWKKLTKGNPVAASSDIISPDITSTWLYLAYQNMIANLGQEYFTETALKISLWEITLIIHGLFIPILLFNPSKLEAPALEPAKEIAMQQGEASLFSPLPLAEITAFPRKTHEKHSEQRLWLILTPHWPI